ncbi:MAG: type IV toxin-antitoxin system AbiEi family antitoxin domain-containing protein, partial [Leifsonia sp.]
MREELEFLSSLEDGLISSQRLHATGFDARGIDRLIAAAELVRVRRGWYATSANWAAEGRDGRYRMLIRATDASSPHGLTVSHLSAVAMHGLPTIGDWPTTVHTCDPQASGGSKARYITTHRAGRTPSVEVIDGVAVVSLARALVDVAVTESPERSVAAIDAALRREAERHRRAWRDPQALRGAPFVPLSADVLLNELDAVDPPFHRARAEAVIRFADARSGSPGESLSRVRMRQANFVIPELQVRFPEVLGRVAEVDFYLDGIRKIQEFDGKFKYTRGAIVKPNEDPGEIVWKEKRRE